MYSSRCRENSRPKRECSIRVQRSVENAAMTARALASYRNCLAPEDTTLLDRPLDTIANRWRPIVRGTRWEPWCHAFERRYVDLSESEGLAPRSA
jgi:hypothetical protein